MSEHTSQQSDPIHTIEAGTAGPDHSHIDLVAGDLPVPITVWRTARGGADPSPTISARLAERLVSAYSRPGEAVIDLTDLHALTAACQRGRRSHHRAWFTEASSLIVGPRTPAVPVTGAAAVHPANADRARDEPDAAELTDWFGDDLTDDLPPHDGQPPALVDDDASLQGRASLIVANWPLDASGEAANRVRLAFLLAACRRLLGPGGCLVLVVAVPAGTVAAPEDFTHLIGAASNAALGYLQHIVALGADTDADRFIYHATDEELLALAQASTRQTWYLHVRVQADLLVFTTRPILTRPDAPPGTVTTASGEELVAGEGGEARA